MNSYASLCDDFRVSTYVQQARNADRAKLSCTSSRLQKVALKMTEFEKRGDNEYMLEEDRDAGSYR